jgi:hypothetical protein
MNWPELIAFFSFRQNYIARQFYEQEWSTMEDEAKRNLVKEKLEEWQRQTGERDAQWKDATGGGHRR